MGVGMFMIRCKRLFAEAHRMSLLETYWLFLKYDVRGDIKYYYPLIGHYGSDGVNIARNCILQQGGRLPDIPASDGKRRRA